MDRGEGGGMVIYPKEWTCERTTRQLEPYLLGTLVLHESLAVAEHVEACSACAQRLVIYRTRVVQWSRHDR
jgi:Putative zinc-finger